MPLSKSDVEHETAKLKFIQEATRGIEVIPVNVAGASDSGINLTGGSEAPDELGLN